MYYALQQYEAALADYSRAIELDPKYTQAYTNRGTTYDALQQYEVALADYGRAIELDSNFAQAYYNRGNTYKALQQFEAALVDYKRAIKLDPSFAQAYVNIGVLLGNQGQLREALPYFEKAAQLGLSQGAQNAAQVRQMLGLETARQTDPAQQAFEAFQRAYSLGEMQRATTEFPFMTDADFITVVEQIIRQRVATHLKPAFEQRLTWLRYIANKQK